MADPKPISVHRCRFVDFTPSAITALAFPPLPLPSYKGKKSAAIRKQLTFGTLAVGRANGNIELCEWSGLEHEQQAPQAWVVKKTLSGPYTSKVDSLVFTIRDPDLTPSDQTPALSDLRLFSAGGGSDLAEWDLERGKILRTISSQGGSIWAIAPNPASTILALGCEDGSIHLLSIDFDALSHLRRFDRVKSRILSLAWGPPVPRETAKNNEKEYDSDEDDGDGWEDSWLVAGCSDSCLRKWDVGTGRVLDRMATEKNRGERTLVWTVGVLGDGTIISGDSLGTVKFWDSRTCTQLHSFQAHGADVLCLTISPEGQAVYTAGVDQKIVQFTHVKTSQPASSTSTSTKSSLLTRTSTSRWVQSFARRMHSHDIRSLSIFPPHTPLPPSHTRTFPADIAPILASGGLDMSVVLTPAALPVNTRNKVVNPLSTSAVATWEDAYHRRVGYSSGAWGRSGVSIAKEARLVCCVREAGVSLWRIKKRNGKEREREDEMDVDGAVGEEAKADGGWERVLDMELNVQSNLVAGAVSDDGRWVVVSDCHETKLFQLESLPNGQLKPKRIRTLTSTLLPYLTPNSASPSRSKSKSRSSEPISTGSSSVAFTPDSTKLVLASSASTYVLVLDMSMDTPRVLRKFEHHRSSSGLIDGRVVKGSAKVAAATKEAEADGAEAKAVEDEEEEDKDDDEVEEDEYWKEDEKVVSTVITRIAVSPDGQWLATTDDRCRTHVFNLDSIQHQCVLPSFPHPIHALSFLPSPHSSTLVLGLANNTIQVYDVEIRTFPSWSKHLITALPHRFRHLHDPIVGVTFNNTTPAEGRTAVFWGSTWICKIQLDAGTMYGGFEKKRRRGADGKKRKDIAPPPPPVPVPAQEGEDEQEQPLQHSPNNFKIITTYRPILFAEFIAPGEMVVVERPLVDVLAKMPPAYFKPKYGAS